MIAELVLPSVLKSRAANSLSKIMIIDDEPVNVKIARKYLETAGYRNFVTTSNASDALDLILHESPDLILLDVMMPDISGLEILQQVRATARINSIPIIVFTASSTPSLKCEALQLGATDFLTKPVDPHELTARVRNALMLKANSDRLEDDAQRLQEEIAKRTAELAMNRLEVIHCLARAAEYRDNETGRHVLRVGCYVGVIARALGLDDATVELLEHASPLHDVGKIGIPDSILLKPGRLTPEEYEIMQGHSQRGARVFEILSSDEWGKVQGHTEIGSQILGNSQSPLLRMASRIALTHHERWDGKGYPLSLSGEDIPLEGRITAVADVFDALSSKRPYKPAFPTAECFQILIEGRGQHFDPKVIDAFLSAKEKIVEIQIRYAELATD
jgi:putative two-component system response regulator